MPQSSIMRPTLREANARVTITILDLQNICNRISFSRFDICRRSNQEPGPRPAEAMPHDCFALPVRGYIRKLVRQIQLRCDGNSQPTSFSPYPNAIISQSPQFPARQACPRVHVDRHEKAICIRESVLYVCSTSDQPLDPSHWHTVGYHSVSSTHRPLPLFRVVLKNASSIIDKLPFDSKLPNIGRPGCVRDTYLPLMV